MSQVLGQPDQGQLQIETLSQRTKDSLLFKIFMYQTTHS